MHELVDTCKLPTKIFSKKRRRGFESKKINRLPPRPLEKGKNPSGGNSPAKQIWEAKNAKGSSVNEEEKRETKKTTNTNPENKKKPHHVSKRDAFFWVDWKGADQREESYR